MLFLHGKSTSGPNFAERLRPFTDTLPPGTPLSFPTSPRGLEWWTLPPGVRSATAEEYPGYDSSEAFVLAQLAERPHSAVLGQSQGAILLLAMLARGKLPGGAGAPNLVLNGVQYPGPFAELLESLNQDPPPEQERYPGRVLLLVGENDGIAPPAGAGRCAAVLGKLVRGGNFEVCGHPGDHGVPVEGEAADAMRRVMCG
ncbi:hypothetical protein TeGR_g5718 [Tetraparma gracilis]|uniref:Serine hydrolase domain-containing protein n=1 Tax=Tetraparma gracilis TaxID=2962635 RepID=A0ABQ6MPD7_9STRA|nr:hypothetical protein TeGR_g5718 [Tetraparma gracilis]